MSGIFGTLLIVFLIAGWAALAARSLWRKRACGCGGSCAGCGGCHLSAGPSPDGPRGQQDSSRPV